MNLFIYHQYRAKAPEINLLQNLVVISLCINHYDVDSLKAGLFHQSIKRDSRNHLLDDVLVNFWKSMRMQKKCIARERTEKAARLGDARPWFNLIESRRTVSICQSSTDGNNIVVILISTPQFLEDFWHRLHCYTLPTVLLYKIMERVVGFAIICTYLDKDYIPLSLGKSKQKIPFSSSPKPEPAITTAYPPVQLRP